MTDPTALADELERLAKAATPGPWEVQDGSSWRRIGTAWPSPAGQHDGNVLHPCNDRSDNHPNLSAGRGENVHHNLDLMVFAANHALAIAKLLRAGEEAEAALKMIRHCWAGHSEQCATVVLRPSGKCDCDWPKVADQCDSALAAYDASAQPAAPTKGDSDD